MKRGYLIIFLAILLLSIKSYAQNKHDKFIPGSIAYAQKQIIGKWRDVNDSNSITIFTQDSLYEFYEKDLIGKARYVITDSCCAYNPKKKKKGFDYLLEYYHDNGREGKSLFYCYQIMYVGPGNLSFIAFPSDHYNSYVKVK